MHNHDDLDIRFIKDVLYKKECSDEEITELIIELLRKKECIVSVAKRAYIDFLIGYSIVHYEKYQTKLSGVSYLNKVIKDNLFILDQKIIEDILLCIQFLDADGNDIRFFNTINLLEKRLSKYSNKCNNNSDKLKERRINKKVLYVSSNQRGKI